MKEFCEICGYRHTSVLTEISVKELTDEDVAVNWGLTICPNCQATLQYLSNLYGFFDFNDERYIQEIRKLKNTYSIIGIELYELINTAPYNMYQHLLIKE